MYVCGYAHAMELAGLVLSYYLVGPGLELNASGWAASASVP